MEKSPHETVKAFLLSDKIFSRGKNVQKTHFIVKLSSFRSKINNIKNSVLKNVKYFNK